MDDMDLEDFSFIRSSQLGDMDSRKGADSLEYPSKTSLQMTTKDEIEKEEEEEDDDEEGEGRVEETEKCGLVEEGEVDWIQRGERVVEGDFLLQPLPLGFEEREEEEERQEEEESGKVDEEGYWRSRRVKKPKQVRRFREILKQADLIDYMREDGPARRASRRPLHGDGGFLSSQRDVNIERWDDSQSGWTAIDHLSNEYGSDLGLESRQGREEKNEERTSGGGKDTTKSLKWKQISNDVFQPVNQAARKVFSSMLPFRREKKVREERGE